jgi:hypothetical protein
VLAHTLVWGDGRLVALHNLGSEPADVPILLKDTGKSQLNDLLSGEVMSLTDDGQARIPLEGYGHRWLRVVREPDTRQY